MRIKRFLLIGIFQIVLCLISLADDGVRFAVAEGAIQQAIDARNIPGAVLVVGTDRGIVYRKAFGHRAVQPATQPMREDTVFDLASLTKPIACATAVMKLVDQGKISVTDPVSKYLPECAGNGKGGITIEQLLLHRGGLVADNPMKDYEGTPAESWKKICDLKTSYEPGSKMVYSDVGFIILGKLVEKASGNTLDQYVAREICQPLKMTDSGYLPANAIRARCAPTEKRAGDWMMGQVHDPRAYALGGVAGHAGLFGSAEDVARWCRMLLNQGEVDGTRILAASSVQIMTKARPLPDGSASRGYGVDVDSSYSPAPRGERFEKGTTFGHTGFTGTSLWIDPINKVFYVLLTNRVHPDGKGEVRALRSAVATAVGNAMLGELTDTAPVLAGIDVLKQENFASLAGRKIAIITNQTGRDLQGNRTVDVLFGAKNLTVVRLFSPEHGLYGNLDEKVGHGVDEATKLKVYSLYGETRKPTAAMLEGVDTLVFDIQDVGARFYTYSATLGLCMEAAKAHNLKMVVLDRPNPITGNLVDGPIAEKEFFGFTAYGPLPVSHGMTFGELAKLYHDEYKVDCDLTVAPMRGWKRRMWFDETGMTWINPSPNMRNLTQALLYPAVCLLEATNVSVGRGCDQPFETFGAPWIDGPRLAAALNASNLPGLRFIPIEFTPTSSKFKNEKCSGVYIIVTERNQIEPVRSGLTMAWQLRRLHGEKFEIDKVVRLLHNRTILDALKQTDDPARLPPLWNDELSQFRQIRERYLMYR